MWRFDDLFWRVKCCGCLTLHRHWIELVIVGFLFHITRNFEWIWIDHVSIIITSKKLFESHYKFIKYLLVHTFI